MRAIGLSILLSVMFVSGVWAQEISQGTSGQLHKSLTHLREGVDALEKTNQQIETQISTMPDNINHLREKLNGLQAQAQDLIAELKKIEKKEALKNKNMAGYEQTLSELHRQIKAVQKDQGKVMERFTKAAEKQRKVMDQKLKLSEEIDQLNARATTNVEDKIEGDVMTRKMALNQDLLLKNDQVAELLTELEKKKEAMIDPLSQHDALVEEKEALKQQLASVKETPMDDIEQTENKILMSGVEQKKFMRIRQEVEELEREKASLKNEIEHKNQVLVAAEGESLKLSPTAKKMMSGVQTLKKQQDTLKMEYNNLRQQMVEMDKERIRLERLIDAYRKMGY